MPGATLAVACLHCDDMLQQLHRLIHLYVYGESNRTETYWSECEDMKFHVKPMAAYPNEVHVSELRSVIPVQGHR